jgi:hypothetical protein
MKAAIPLKGIATQTKPADPGSKTLAWVGRLCWYSPRLLACGRFCQIGMLPYFFTTIHQQPTFNQSPLPNLKRKHRSECTLPDGAVGAIVIRVAH